MLKITELRNAMNAAEASAEAAEFYGDAERVYLKAHKSYYAELDAGRALKAQYEAMGDECGSGICNAGDTYGPEYGDIRFSSTEFWQCAIDTVQMMYDCGQA